MKFKVIPQPRNLDLYKVGRWVVQQSQQAPHWGGVRFGMLNPVDYGPAVFWEKFLGTEWLPEAQLKYDRYAEIRRRVITAARKEWVKLELA